MSQTMQQTNKALVLEAFETLFNKRDYEAATRYWSPNYMQHSAHIAPGREGLFNLIKSMPPTLKYEPGVIVADGDLVIVHGRFSGFGATVNWIAADILRIEDGLLVEHWDVIQDEATQEQSNSGLPMFGKTFPNECCRSSDSHCNSPLTPYAAACPSCSSCRDGVVRAVDRAGTASNKTVKPSAMVGCAKIASRREVYGS